MYQRNFSLTSTQSWAPQPLEVRLGVLEHRLEQLQPLPKLLLQVVHQLVQIIASLFAVGDYVPCITVRVTPPPRKPCTAANKTYKLWTGQASRRVGGRRRACSCGQRHAAWVHPLRACQLSCLQTVSIVAGKKVLIGLICRCMVTGTHVAFWMLLASVLQVFALLLFQYRWQGQWAAGWSWQYQCQCQCQCVDQIEC